MDTQQQIIRIIQNRKSSLTEDLSVLKKSLEKRELEVTELKRKIERWEGSIAVCNLLLEEIKAIGLPPAPQTSQT